MEMDFVKEPLEGKLGNLGSKAIEEHNKVVVSLMGHGYYIKNPCKLDLDF